MIADPRLERENHICVIISRERSASSVLRPRRPGARGEPGEALLSSGAGVYAPLRPYRLRFVGVGAPLRGVHPNAYEDFVEGIRPKLTGDKVGCEIREGVLLDS